MPIENFEGNMFAVFTDISGFRELMKTEESALHALDCLYSSGFNLIN